MKAEQKIWSFGDAKSYEYIYNIFKNAGAEDLGKNSDSKSPLYFSDPEKIYFIDHTNKVCSTNRYSEFASVIMDSYKHIKIPRSFKDGDLLYSKIYNSFVVFKSKINDNVFNAYIYISEGDKKFLIDTKEFTENYELADHYQFLLFELWLDKINKAWDFENKILKDVKFPVEGDEYYYITLSHKGFSIIKNIFHKDNSDCQQDIDSGNLFKYEKDAEAVTSLMEELFEK